MFNVKNLAKKFVTGAIASSVVLAGLSAVPMTASADNGLHLGSFLNVKSDQGDNGLHLGTGVKAKAHVKAEKDDDHDGKIGVGAQFGADVKAAQTTFKLAVKNANMTFKAAVKVAHNKFVAAMEVATNQAQKVVALKAYFADKLAAMKVKSATIEAAFQTFIDAKFNQ